MKRYEQIAKNVLEAYALVRGRDVEHFTIRAYAPTAMNVQVWLDYKDNTAVRDTLIKLKDGTPFELSLRVAEWLKVIEFETIPAAFDKWTELNADVEDHRDV